jgi:hypothetical protein
MAVKGDTGNTGSQGVTGNTGSQGPIGNTGPSGIPSGGSVGQVVTNTAAGAGTWQDVAGGGRVLQVASGVTTAGINSYSGSWTNMVQVNITPTRADSKIAIFVNIGSMYMNLNSAVAQFYWKIARNGLNITGHNTNFHAEIGRGETNIGQRGFLSMSGVDSPNSSSEIIYSAQAARQNGTGGVLINDTAGTSSIIVMEIGV